MADIIIHKDEKLKLDYLLQKLKENNTSKNIKIDDGQGVLDYTKTESVIYNPQGETGTTTIKINNQKIEIQVTDIPDEGLQHHWVVKEGDDSTVIEDIVNGADFELNEEYTWNPSSGVGDLWIDESGSVVNSTDDRVQLGDSATQIIPIAPSGHDNSTSSGIGRFGHWEEDNRIYWDYADGGFGFGIASSETAFTGVGSDELDLMRTVALRWDSGNADVFINGEHIASTSYSGSIDDMMYTSWSFPRTIGVYISGQILFYDRALSDEEISNIGILH